MMTCQLNLTSAPGDILGWRIHFDFVNKSTPYRQACICWDELADVLIGRRSIIRGYIFPCTFACSCVAVEREKVYQKQ